MNGYRFYCRLVTALLISGALILFTGCQSLKGAGSPGTVELGTADLNFGSVVVGTSATLPNTITNNTTSSVTISSIQGLSSEFQVTGLTLPVAVAAGQSVSFSVVFQPAVVGDPTITILFDGENSQAIVSLPTTGVGTTVGKLSPNPSQIIFGNIVVGSTQSGTVALSNSGGSDVVITQATMSGAGFTMSNLSVPMTLHPGGSTSTTITFAPPSTGNFSGSITFATTTAGLSSNVIFNLAGAGVPPGTLTPSPSSLAFGSIQVGTKTSLSETLTNTGASSVTISQATASGTGFSISGLTLPVTLPANQTASFTATFSPSSVGAATGSLSIVSNASNSPLSIPFSGTALAAGALSANPSSATFGNVTVGSNQTVPVSVTNTGGETVTISSAVASGTGFSFTGQTPPVTLNAGQSATFNAIFTPSATGAASGTLTINSNASNPTLSIPLSGTGVAPGQLASNPTSFSFGNIQIGTSKSLSGTLTNNGGTSITISAASASGTGFSLSGLSLPVTLTAGQSTSF
ncbi:MAG: choice-of-anchor D domain-containing protein, partial [Terriglobales bacterium]